MAVTNVVSIMSVTGGGRGGLRPQTRNAFGSQGLEEAAEGTTEASELCDGRPTEGFGL